MAQHRPEGSVIRFLKNRGCIRSSVREDEPVTHLLMDGTRGGKIVLPDALMDDFNSLLAQDLMDHVTHHVIECRSPVFRLHYDLDFDVIASKKDVERYVMTMVDCVASYFEWGREDPQSRQGTVRTAKSATSLASQESNSDDEEAQGKENRTEYIARRDAKDPLLTCIVCAVTESLGSDARKAPGLHLIFPYIHVDDDKALWIRNGLVYSMMRAEGNADVDWEKAIDLAVVTKNGLRLVGNDKSRKCALCHGNGDAVFFCEACNRAGKISENKVYWPWFVHSDSDNSLIYDMHNNLAYALKMCSIRLRSGTALTPGFCPPTGAPGPSIMRKLPGRKKQSCGDACYILTDADGGDTHHSTRSTAHVSASIRELIQNAIRSFHPAYNRTLVKDVQQVVKRGGLRTYAG